MSLHYHVDQVENGYIVTDRYGFAHVFEALDDVFRYLLDMFERRGPGKYAQLYGDVRIIRDQDCQPEQNAEPAT